MFLKLFLAINVEDESVYDLFSITRTKRYGYGLIDIQLSKNGKKEIEWTLYAKRLRGLVGYGITTFPLPVDVQNRDKFDENTIMVRNNSGFINGGKSDKNPHSRLQWKTGETIKCQFDRNNGSFKMRKVFLIIFIIFLSIIVLSFSGKSLEKVLNFLNRKIFISRC